MNAETKDGVEERSQYFLQAKYIWSFHASFYANVDRICHVIHKMVFIISSLTLSVWKVIDKVYPNIRTVLAIKILLHFVKLMELRTESRIMNVSMLSMILRQELVQNGI